MRKRAISTAIILTAAIICVLATPAQAKYSGGTGEPDDPYQISDFNDLMAMRADSNDWDKCFILTADIDLDPNLPGRIVFDRAVIAYDPDADYIFDGTIFTGSFDGNAHVIRNLTIDSNDAGNDFLGLIGYSHNADIRNLGLENCCILGFRGSSYVGAFVGIMWSGSLFNCYSTGLIEGSSRSGGLCGSNSGSIVNCRSSANIVGGDQTGGLSGQNSGNIFNSYSTGNVIANSPYVDELGGICGYNYRGAIVNCYSTGFIQDGLYSNYVAGFCGRSNDGFIVNCYSTSNVADGVLPFCASIELGGAIGCYFLDIGTSSSCAVPLTDSQMRNASSYSGWDFIGNNEDGTCGFWQMPDDGGYPVLSFFSGNMPDKPTGKGTEKDPYLIRDVNDLGTIAWNYTAHYRLANDLDLSGITWSTGVIPLFSGVFDGNDCRISNLTINGGGDLGLFGGIESVDAQVKNLILEDANVVGSGCSIGALAGYSKAKITNCRSSGVVTVNDYSKYVGGLCGHNISSIIIGCDSQGTVTGAGDSESVGGLCGRNYLGLITNCSSGAQVDGSYAGGLCGNNYYYGIITNSYATGSIFGNRAGGLCGYNEGSSIINCYATGPVSGNRAGGLCGYVCYGRIVNCHSTGRVTGGAYTAGLCGYLYGFHPTTYISNCFWDVESSGQEVGYRYLSGSLEKGRVSNLVGLTSDQMKSQSNFTDLGWDFCNENANGTSNIWKMSAKYPVISVSEGYVLLTLPGSGTLNDPYLISSADELGAASWHPDSAFRLTNNINLQGMTWSPAVFPFFIGSFDGNDFTIDNLKVIGDGYMGLFGEILSVEHLENLGLNNVSIVGSIYSFNMGALIGFCDRSSITNCYAKGQIDGWHSLYLGGICGRVYRDSKFTDCHSSVQIHAESSDDLGGFCGLAGDSSNSFLNCYSNSTISGKSYLGGFCGSNSAIITNCYSTGSLSGGAYVGGLCGSNSATITNCYSITTIEQLSGSIRGGLCGSNSGTVSRCYAIGDVGGFSNVGGLSGDNSGTILHSHSAVNVAGNQGIGGLCGSNSCGTIISCYAKGSVTGDHILGGLVGSNSSAEVSNCFSTSQVEGGSVVGGLIGLNWDEGDGPPLMNKCYSVGTVTASRSYGGGLIGQHDDGEVISSFWNLDICPLGIGLGSDPNVIGKNTDDMQTEATFTDAGWDFLGEVANGPNDVWAICEGTNYPRLVWSIPAGDIVCPDGVDADDLSLLADNWLQERVAHDIFPEGGDGIVNMRDYAKIVGQWPDGGDMSEILDFSEQWLLQGSYEDIDIAPAVPDGIIDFLDFAVLAKDWMKME